MVLELIFSIYFRSKSVITKCLHVLVTAHFGGGIFPDVLALDRRTRNLPRLAIFSPPTKDIRRRRHTPADCESSRPVQGL